MSRRNFSGKRKYLTSEKEKSNDTDLTKIISENLFETLFDKKKKHKKDNEEVYREYNHIYFRSDVSIDSIDDLLRCIREFEEEVMELKCDPYSKYITHPDLYIHISSYGGDLYASLMAYDTMKLKHYAIITVAEGFVASAGTVMMLGGKKRQIQKSAVMLIHQLSTSMYGKFEELKEEFHNSEQDMKRLINIYHNELKSKMTKKQIEDALKHDYWWDAQTCVNKGLCDEVL
jgi:ATP-dependent protease ClpP protease subunit